MAGLKGAGGENKMDDLEKYIEKRKKCSSEFADGFERGYEQFNRGVMFRMAREEAGLTQEEHAVSQNLPEYHSVSVRLQNALKS